MSATYRVGPSDFFTSGDLQADALTFNGQINALNNANWDRPSQGLFDAFQTFLAEWRAFYSSTFTGLLGGWTVAFNNGNRDQLIQFEERLQEFIQRYETESGRALPAPVVAPSAGTKDTFGDHLRKNLQPLIPNLDIRWVALALVAAGALFYFRGPILRGINKVGAA